MAVSVTCVGDIIMGGAFIGTASAREPVRKVLRSADHCFVNLELPLTGSTSPTDKLICLQAPPSLAAELRLLGADVATFANNHAMDFGVEGLRDTLQALESAGIAAVGAGMTLAESLKPAVLPAQGARIAYIGVTTTLANGSGAGLNRPGVAPIRITTRYVIDAVTIQETPGMSPFAETVADVADQDKVHEALRKAAAENDLVIVGIHWGVPSGFVAAVQDELADYQRPMGRALIDAGASAVVGHHPHYLQGVEFHNGRPIFYSIGNFVIHDMIPSTPGGDRPYPAYSFDSIKSDLSRIGAILRLSWRDLGAGPACTLIPVLLNADGEPELADQHSAEQARAQIAHSSRKLNADVTLAFKDGIPEIAVSDLGL